MNPPGAKFIPPLSEQEHSRLIDTTLPLREIARELAGGTKLGAAMLLRLAADLILAEAQTTYTEEQVKRAVEEIKAKFHGLLN